MSERSKEHAWKACIRLTPYRGFESHSLRQILGGILKFHGSLRRLPGSGVLQTPSGPEGSSGSSGVAGRQGLTQAATHALLC